MFFKFATGLQNKLLLTQLLPALAHLEAIASSLSAAVCQLFPSRMEGEHFWSCFHVWWPLSLPQMEAEEGKKKSRKVPASWNSLILLLFCQTGEPVSCTGLCVLKWGPEGLLLGCWLCSWAEMQGAYFQFPAWLWTILLAHRLRVLTSTVWCYWWNCRSFITVGRIAVAAGLWMSMGEFLIHWPTHSPLPSQV